MHNEGLERKAKAAGAAWRKRLGEAVRTARGERGLSQEGLATLIGATPGTISEIERGLTTPSLGTVWAIADRLLMPIDMVVGRSSRVSLLEEITQPASVSGKESPALDDQERIQRLESELREMRAVVDDLLKSEGQPKSKKRGARSA